MNFTPIVKPLFNQRIKVVKQTENEVEAIQRQVLSMLLKTAKFTEIGRKYDFASITRYEDYREIMPINQYEDLREPIMRMVGGQRDVLWCGVVKNFAQSSGTSDGKSKYIPITKDSFKGCHYQGGFDVVAHYLNLNPTSKIFSGKSFILGGSFGNELNLPKGVMVGDLSANLIYNINPLANIVRVPDKQTALMQDWEKKLPALVEASRQANITNISGVPSWFLTVIKEVIKKEGAATIHDVWPNLEVFFHGGISFVPYREQYAKICDNSKMNYLETYNASEGFFAVQTSWDTSAMQLLLDVGVFYEFIPIEDIDSNNPRVYPAWEVEKGKVYAMIISANNGLWRYNLGDTVKVESTSPLIITIAGRTKHFINAFG